MSTAAATTYCRTFYNAGAYFLPVALCLASATGCSSGLNLTDVTGNVTKDGTPLVDALVEFYPEGKAAPSYGKTDEDGNFKLYYSTGPSGAFVGEHRVHIIGGRKKDGAATQSPAVAAAEGEPVPVADPEAAAPGGPQAKVLTATVSQQGPNHIELKL